MIRQFGENEGKPGVRIDLIEFTSLDERIDGSGSPPAKSDACQSGRGMNAQALQGSGFTAPST